MGKIAKRDPHNIFEIAVWINGQKYSSECYTKERTAEEWSKLMEEKRRSVIRYHGFEEFDMHEMVSLTEHYPDGFQVSVDLGKGGGNADG